jgi:hypothetical protein
VIDSEPLQETDLAFDLAVAHAPMQFDTDGIIDLRVRSYLSTTSRSSPLLAGTH